MRTDEVCGERKKLGGEEKGFGAEEKVRRENLAVDERIVNSIL